MGFLSDLSGVTGARAADQARLGVQGAQNTSVDAMNNAYGQANQYLNRGRDAYAPVIQRGQTYGAVDPVLLSAYGIGDPSLAQNAFRAGPGYDYAINEGLDAAQRRANSTGGGVGGNILAELQSRGQGMANQEFNNWRGGLGGLAQMGGQYALSGAQGQAGADQGLAGLATGYGQNTSNVLMNSANQQGQYLGQAASSRGAGAANIAGLGMNLAKLAGSGGGYGAGYGAAYGGY